MAIQNVIGDSFRGATWVSIHNGGGVGWGEVINGGFGLTIDGSKDSEEKISNMLFWDVNNGIARRNWARNNEAIFALLISGFSFLIAAALVYKVKDVDDVVQTN